MFISGGNFHIAKPIC